MVFAKIGHAPATLDEYEAALKELMEEQALTPARVVL